MVIRVIYSLVTSVVVVRSAYIASHTSPTPPLSPAGTTLINLDPFSPVVKVSNIVVKFYC